MNRVDKIMEFVDETLAKKISESDKRHGYVHLYGVAQACALIAKKRGIDVELAIITGLLHDLYTYKKKCEVRHLGMDAIQEVIKNHRLDGPIWLREVLADLNLTTEDETNMICDAIQGGIAKDDATLELERVVNDANIMQFYLCNPTNPKIKFDDKRISGLLAEFGVNF